MYKMASFRPSSMCLDYRRCVNGSSVHVIEALRGKASFSGINGGGCKREEKKTVVVA